MNTFKAQRIDRLRYDIELIDSSIMELELKIKRLTETRDKMEEELKEGVDKR